MRVLIVHPGIYFYGGAELLIVKLVNYLTRKGVNNAILTTAILPEVKKDLLNPDVRILNKIPVSHGGFGDGLALHQGVGKLSGEFDLINLHNYPAELAMFLRKKPSVWMCNEPAEVALGLEDEPSLFRRTLIRGVLGFDKFVVRRYISRAVVADRYNAARFERIYGFEPEIIPYGIDYDFFAQGGGRDILNKFNWKDSFVALQVGIFGSYKNQLESVKVIERLKDKIPNIKLILAGWGGGAYIRRVKDYIKQKNLEKDVVITGGLPREAIRSLYHASSILLHPIRDQGGWLAPFEALCAAKPVVVSSKMTAAEIIAKEKIGVVTDDYTQAIIKIKSEYDRYREIGRRGREWVKNNLSWDIFCEKMLKVFYQAGKLRRERR